MDLREAEAALLALVAACGDAHAQATVDGAFRVARAMSPAPDVDDASWFALLSAIAAQRGRAGELAAQAAAAHVAHLNGMRPRSGVPA
jgi:hypothetical protein